MLEELHVDKFYSVTWSTESNGPKGHSIKFIRLTDMFSMPTIKKQLVTKKS